MGLAASQARLLCITMRIDDDQYKLLKLSAEQLSLCNEKTALAEEYDFRINAVNYEYDGVEQFSYSGLMGSAGLTAGLENPVFITNAQNKVVLDGAYGMAMQSAYLASNGKPQGSSVGFNAFVAQITGDGTTDWSSAAKGTVKSTGSSNGASNAQGADVKTDDKTSNNGTTTTIRYTAEADALRQKYDDAQEYVYENFGYQPAKPGLKPKQNEIANDYDRREEFRQGPSKFIEDQRFTEDTITDTTIDTNDKDYNYYTWTKAVNNYCKQQGLEATYVINGGYPPEANVTETVTVPTSTTPTTQPTTNTTPETTGSDSGSVREDGKVNNEQTIKTAKYYLQIYNQACNNGYVVDDNITNRDYLNAQLENNNLKIGGMLVNEQVKAKKMTMSTMRENEDEKAKIDSWYKKEQSKNEAEEKRITNKQTAVQAELSALTAEQSSVQSIIDKNIERSFTYCQNG